MHFFAKLMLPYLDFRLTRNCLQAIASTTIRRGFVGHRPAELMFRRLRDTVVFFFAVCAVMNWYLKGTEMTQTAADRCALLR